MLKTYLRLIKKYRKRIFVDIPTSWELSVTVEMTVFGRPGGPALRDRLSARGPRAPPPVQGVSLRQSGRVCALRPLRCEPGTRARQPETPLR